ncbi:MAG: cobalt ECF transporter T component CbiQ [Acidimicrobiia bacterium]|nr:cobalt ECF transporter T component CbiQ [Acidimicrobiia bacterium]
MGGPHRHLHVHADTPAARLPAHTKLAGLFLFVLAVALTPPRWAAAMAIYGLIVVTAVVVAKLPFRTVAVRLLVIAPFVVFAITLPFIAGGPRVEVGPLRVSETGLWNAFGIVAKAAIGASATILVASTTAVPEVMTGLRRLRLPAAMVTIIAFMWRYLDLIASESGRMRLAMAARGYQPRWLWHARPLANATGALFVRTYERGERVHQAMLARGWTGEMPETSDVAPVQTMQWAISLAPATAAALVLIAGAFVA